MTYTTYTSKTLGGLVVELAHDMGVRRAVIRANGKATIYYTPNGGKIGVQSYGVKGKAQALEMLAAAKVAQ